MDSAVIYNNSEKPVQFFVYNYIDVLYAVSAMKCLVAPQHFGVVVASGKFYKIHPDDHANQQFMVAPRKAYVYSGPGKVRPV